MTRAYATGMLIVLALIIFALLWRGWRARARRQHAIAPLPAVPPSLTPALFACSGQYVTTTVEDDWLDRLVVHGLGLRTQAHLSLHREGVLIARREASDIFIPLTCLANARTAGGMAGKFVGGQGLLIVTWQHGHTHLDTGFRARYRADHLELLRHLEILLAQPGQTRRPELLPPQPKGST